MTTASCETTTPRRSRIGRLFACRPMPPAAELRRLYAELVAINAKIDAALAEITTIAEEQAAAPAMNALYARQRAIEGLLAELPAPTSLAEAAIWAQIASSEDWRQPAGDFGDIAAQHALDFLAEMKS